jgi:hypothetical protein
VQRGQRDERTAPHPLLPVDRLVRGAQPAPVAGHGTGQGPHLGGRRRVQVGQRHTAGGEPGEVRHRVDGADELAPAAVRLDDEVIGAHVGHLPRRVQRVGAG